MSRLLILSQYYKPEIGAPQNRLLEMALGLKEQGWEIRVYTGMPNYPTGRIFPEYRGKPGMREELDGIPVRRFWFYTSNSKRSLPRILSMLSFSFRVLFSYASIRRFHPDYLLVESPPLLLALSGKYLAKWTRSKLILNISDLWPLSAKELGAISDGFLYRRLLRLERRLYEYASICMGQSGEIVDYMDSHGAQKTYLFRNGVDPDRFRPVAGKEDADRKGIVYTGLLGVAQGIVSICKNIDFQELGSHFYIYGNGPELEELMDYLQKNPHRGITYCGQVAREMIPGILMKHEASLIPLVGKIFGAVPSKIYESMAAGLPILFSGKGEAAGIIEQHNLGWISAPGDYKQLAENIGRISGKGEEVETKRRNCLRAAREEFNRPLQVKSLHTFLSNEKDL